MSASHTGRPDQRLRLADQWFATGTDSARPAPTIELQCSIARPAWPRRRRRGPHVGFTLFELLVAVTVAGVLAGLAYPSFASQIRKARRADVLVSMMQVQLAQERWRSNNSSYGSLAQIGVAAASASGYYSLQVSQQDGDGYQVMATAAGPQTSDTDCLNLRLTVAGANVIQDSGPDSTVANPSAANRRCWNL